MNGKYLHQLLSSQLHPAEIDSARLYKCEIRNQVIEVDNTVDYGSLPPGSGYLPGYSAFQGNGEDIIVAVVYLKDSSVREPLYYYFSIGKRVAGADDNGDNLYETTFTGPCYSGKYVGRTPDAGKTIPTIEFNAQYKICSSKKTEEYYLKKTWSQKVNPRTSRPTDYDPLVFLLAMPLDKEHSYTATKIITSGGNKIGGHKSVVYDLQKLLADTVGLKFDYSETIIFK